MDRVLRVPTPRPTPRSRQPRPRVARLVAALGAMALIVAVGIAVASTLLAASPEAPHVGTRILVPAASKAASAASDPAADLEQTGAAEWLAHQPTTVWLTPESDPVDAVEERVARLLDEARDQDATLSIAVYGLPDRDCGNQSAGGLSPDAYGEWTARIGRALHAGAGVGKVVILEPDSVALASSCGSIAERAAHLRRAVDNLSGDKTWIYVDAGHSAWHPVDEMAALLQATGLLPDVRGIALNVSNYQDTAAEFAYAHALSDRLGGTHAIIDTSRNGAGPAGAQWCNPRGRLVGSPSGSFGDEVVDTNLWIKPPGESDGWCNGGPAAGTWWPDAAVELTRESR
ncbi:glycoside hydrolase family 6 protein [Microbacterium proteolyticum]|nr:glycoside hydrolase family 6 protein [Microbacterium proteolyticum]